LVPSKHYHHITDECNRDFFATSVSDTSVKIRVKKAKKVKKKKEKAVDDDQDVPYSESLESCKMIINKINPIYAVKRSDWFAIGSALHTTLNGSEEAFNLWVQFSKKNTDTYDYDECVTEWDKGMTDKYKAGTLMWYFNRKF